MKIAILNFYSGYSYRGGETFINELSNRLTKSQKVFVFQAGPATGKEKYQVIQKKVNLPPVWPDDQLPPTHFLKRFFLNYYKRQEFLFTLKCLSDLLKLKPDFIIPLNSGWQALLCSLLSRFLKAKLIIVGQSGLGWDDRWNLLVRPHLFVALTKRQLKWAKKATIWKQDFALIPNGVDLKKFSPAGKKKKLTLKKPIILIVAASTPDKRVGQGIRAIARLKSASLLLLGQGPFDKKLDKLAYRLLGQDRFLHLSVPHQQTPLYYRSANIFTLCSRSSEAFGIAYLEAMASGLPCVATADQSRQEIVGPAGIFVKNPNSASEYSAALNQALVKKWGNLPRNQAKKFSWDSITKKYLNLLTSLIHLT